MDVLEWKIGTETSILWNGNLGSRLQYGTKLKNNKNVERKHGTSLRSMTLEQKYRNSKIYMYWNENMKTGGCGMETWNIGLPIRINWYQNLEYVFWKDSKTKNETNKRFWNGILGYTSMGTETWKHGYTGT